MTTNQGRYASYERRSSYRNTNTAGRAPATARAAATGRSGKTTARGGAYIDGNTVRRLDVVREIEEAPKRRVSNQTRKNREKAARMNLGYVGFLFAFTCMVCAILYGYLSLQTANTSAVAEISSLESQLNTLRLDNDEEYSRIMSSVDLEQIKTRAIEELGMQYAQQGQVVEVENASDDYVRQYKDMP